VAAIGAGAWRPHRSTRSEEGDHSHVWVVCANDDWPAGVDEEGRPNGHRWEGWKPKSQIDRAKHVRIYSDAQGRPCALGLPCSQKCAEIVLKGRWRAERTVRRCGGELANGSPCPGFIRITARQQETGGGPKLCQECRASGRRTLAQVESARGALSVNRDTQAARTHRAALGASLGQEVARNRVVGEDGDRRYSRRRRRGADEMGRSEALQAAKLRFQRDRQERQRELITAALRADPMASNKAIASGVGGAMGGVRCGTERVSWLRHQLEDAGEIPRRQNLNGKPRIRPAKNPFAACEYSDSMRDSHRSRPHRQGQANTRAVAEARAQADRAAELHALGWEAAEIAAEIQTAAPSVERYLREGGLSERSPGRREAKQRRRIIKHLAGRGGSDERRNLQRATKLSSTELSARRHELGAETYEVNRRACVRLVSPKTITPLQFDS
jgi:hypothetical protein